LLALPYTFKHLEESRWRDWGNPWNLNECCLRTSPFCDCEIWGKKC